MLSSADNVLCAAVLAERPLPDDYFLGTVLEVGLICQQSFLFNYMGAMFYQFFYFEDEQSAFSAVSVLNARFAEKGNMARVCCGYPFPEFKNQPVLAFAESGQEIPNNDNPAQALKLCGHYPVCAHGTDSTHYHFHFSKVYDEDVRSGHWSDRWSNPAFAVWALKCFQPDISPCQNGARLTEHVLVLVFQQANAGGPLCNLFRFIAQAVGVRNEVEQERKRFAFAVSSARRAPAGMSLCAT